MSEPEPVIQQLREAFGQNAYPGDAYLQGSFEGCEPGEEIGPFVGQQDWRALPAKVLDDHSGALSFFSEAGLRFFLPAFLIADLEGKLRVADPLTTLTHGFSDVTMDLPVGDQVFQVRSGKTALINPQRYGAVTFYDYVRYRFSVFTREEAGAICAYLQLKLEASEDYGKPAIQAALDSFWLERAATAPTRADLREHLDQQQAYLAAVSKRGGPAG